MLDWEKLLSNIGQLAKINREVSVRWVKARFSGWIERR